jgi:hypothetical protein
MPTITRANIRSYDAGTHRASVQVAGSLSVWLDDVPVATGVPAADVVAGRDCAVLFYTDDNPDDAVVVVVHGAPPGAGPFKRIIDADGDTYVHAELNADEDKARVVVGGVLTTLIQTTTPHVDITGDMRISDGLALRGSAPASDKALFFSWTTSATNPTGLDATIVASSATGNVRGVTGEVQVPGSHSGAVSAVRGLEFRANHAGSGTVTDQEGATARIQGTGPATNRAVFAAYYEKLLATATIQAGVRSRLSHTGSLTAPSFDFFRTEGAVLQATVTDLAHYRVGDPTLASGGVITNHYGFLNPGLLFGTNKRPFWDAGISGSTSDAAGNRFRSNTAFGTVATSNLFGGGDGVIFIANAPTAPTSNPTGGGILYAAAGALTWRGSGGTVTTIAPA